MQQTLKIISMIKEAAIHRNGLGRKTDAYRLFNGFYEGYPSLVLDRYGPCLVIFDHGLPEGSDVLFQAICDWAFASDHGMESILLKQRQADDPERKNGILLAGDGIPSSICESGVTYALDLQMNQDAGFYLDTRNLRSWLREHSTEARMLNSFAYTGSLGVAAGTGGANEVIQTDLNEKFLKISLKSWELNELDNKKTRILPGDFFKVTNRMRHQGQLFDIVILDPPFFSSTDAGRVNLEGETTRLINKVRPLAAHGGKLVVINNALFLSGAAFMAELDQLCQSDYLSLDEIIPVPRDITGYPETIVEVPLVDPAPFNHPTKIAILDVTRKDKKTQ
jgi:23S rRNA (cytosine1962-C5)-methyltransferase